MLLNRNVESHFSQLPHVDIQRSQFDRGSTHKTTFNAGEVIPIYLDEVLPGDTFQMTTSKVVRMQTLLTPIMDNVFLDTYFFFVPNRLVWDNWQAFCGENTGSAWVSPVQHYIPTISSPEGGFSSGTLADYFGLPVGVDFSWEPPTPGTTSTRIYPSALPFRAYALIIDQYFRDENLQDPLIIDKGDGTIVGSNGSDQVTDIQKGGKPFIAAKVHDYFTSCLPAPQKGEPVNLLTYMKLPVRALENEMIPLPKDRSVPSIDAAAIKFSKWAEGPGGQLPTGWGEGSNLIFHNRNGNIYAASSNGGSTGLNIGSTIINTDPTEPPSSSFTHELHMTPVNLWAIADSESTLSVNDLRLAFQLQKFYERSARGGTRYIEILQSQFGVSSPDARLQRAEYLGGNRIPIQVHEVTNTAQSEQDFLGDLGALSQTSDRHEDFVKSFTEHGYVIGLCVARYDHSYSQGIERMWMRHSFTDFYLPVFANIGEQPVHTYEIYANADTMKSDGDVFGYQEAWADYRYKPNRISGEMRPGIPNTLASWHLGDYYTQQPTLSAGWVREDKSMIDRTLAVTSQLSNQFFADFYFDCRVTRPMPMYSIPGLIDHN